MSGTPSTPDRPTPDQAPTVVRAAPLRPSSPDAPRKASRWIVPPRAEGWQGLALSEWSLSGARWSDRHPYTETNVVLEGELHVESGGTTVVASVGDTVTVPAGAVGRYWAPVHARMLAIYGPNPAGAGTDLLGYDEL